MRAGREGLGAAAALYCCCGDAQVMVPSGRLKACEGLDACNLGCACQCLRLVGQLAVLPCRLQERQGSALSSAHGCADTYDQLLSSALFSWVVGISECIWVGLSPWWKCYVNNPRNSSHRNSSAPASRLSSSPPSSSQLFSA